MTDKQENRLSMADVTAKVLDLYASSIAGPAFLLARAALGNQLAVIAGYAQLQSKKLTGTAVDKENAQEEAVQACLELIGPTQSFALASNNHQLHDAIDYSATSLRRLRDNVLVPTLNQIRNTIQAEMANLGEYEVTGLQIDNLTAKIAAYSLLVGEPRTALSVRSAATAALVPAFVELDNVLAQLDGLVEGKKRAAPDFYNAYQTARTIVDLGHRKKPETPEEPEQPQG